MTTPHVKPLWKYQTPDTISISKLIISDDGAYVLACCEFDELICLGRDGSVAWQFVVEGQPSSVAASADFQRIVVAGYDLSTIVLLDGGGQPLWVKQFEGITGTDAAISADGHLIAGVTGDGVVRMWDSSGALLWEYWTGRKGSPSMKMSSDGSFIAVAVDDGIYLLNRSGELVWTTPCEEDSRVTAISTDGQYVALMKVGSGVRLMNRQQGVAHRIGVERPNAHSFTPDMAYVAFGTSGNDDVCLYERGGQLLWKHWVNGTVFDVGIDSSGQYVVAGSDDDHVYLFDVDGELIFRERTGDTVSRVCITPDARYVCAHSTDGFIYSYENLLAGQGRAQMTTLVRRRAVQRVRSAFTENPIYGLCIWFEEFSGYIRRGWLEVCDGLLEEVRQYPYPYSAQERAYVDSHEGALWLRRGTTAQRAGKYDEAEACYRRSIEIQRKLGCAVCEQQARLALELLMQERLTGQRDPLLETSTRELHVLGAAEALLSNRLANAHPSHSQQAIAAATRLRLTKPLTQAMYSPNERTRMLAAAALNRFAEISDTAALVRGLQDTNWFVRWQAASALSRRNDLPDMLLPLLTALLPQERDPEVKRLMLVMIGQLGSADLTPLLCTALDDVDPDVRIAAAEALGSVGDRRALMRLDDLTREDSVISGGLLEGSVPSAAHLAMDSISERCPLPDVQTSGLYRRLGSDIQPASVYFADEPVLYIAALNNAAPESRLTLRVSIAPQMSQDDSVVDEPEAAHGSPYIELRGTYADLRAQADDWLKVFAPAPTDTAEESGADFTVEVLDSDSSANSSAGSTGVLAEQFGEAELIIFALSPEATQRWPPAAYNLQLSVYDAMTEHDEPIAAATFSAVDAVLFRDPIICFEPGESEHRAQFVEYVSTFYSVAALAAAPRGITLAAEIRDGGGALVERQSIVNQDEAPHTVAFRWTRDRWQPGHYMLHLRASAYSAGGLADERLLLELPFEVAPYSFEHWTELPQDAHQPGQPSAHYVWNYFAPHLIRHGRDAELIQTVKVWEYLATKAALCGPSSAEADVQAALELAPDDAYLRLLKGHLGRLNHILQGCDSAREVLQTLYLWLEHVPGLSETVRPLAQNLGHPRFEAWHSLPHPHPALSRVLSGHSDRVEDCAFSPDERSLVTVSDDGLILVSDLATGTVRLRLEPSHRPQTRCAISPDGRYIVTSASGALHFWDAATGEHRGMWGGHIYHTLRVCFSPDGKWVASVGSDQTLRVRQVESRRDRIHVRIGSIGHDCAISPDGRVIITAGSDGMLKAWDSATGALLGEMEAHEKQINGCAISPDGSWIVSASEDALLKIWRLRSDSEPMVLRGHSSPVKRCAISPDGRWIASMGQDHTLRLWDAAAGSPIATLHARTQSAHSVAISPNGRFIATSDAGDYVNIWDASLALNNLPAHPRQVGSWSVSVSADGTLALATVDSPGNPVYLWNLAADTLIRVFEGHDDEVLDCAISRDNRWAATASEDRTVKVWEVATGKMRLNLAGHGDAVNRVAISPDSAWLVSASADYTLKTWDAESGALRLTLIGHQSEVWGCAISPDGQRIVSTSSNGSVQLWDAQTGQMLRMLEGHEGPVFDASISPDGRWLATGGRDRALRLWDMESGSLHATLIGHKHSVLACAFSPDGKHLLTGGHDCTLRLWAVESGACLASAHLANDVCRCAWLPDGRHIAVASSDGLYLLQIVRGLMDS